MARHRGLRIGAAAAGAALVLALAACGGGDDSASTTTGSTEPALPEECVGPPVTFDLRAEGEHPAGSEAFEVTEAVARRVAILPGEMALDTSELSGLESKAGVTPLALYTLYLSDAPILRDELSGVGVGAITPAEGTTVAALTMVPTTEAGFTAGDVVTDAEREYETISTLTTLGLTVFADGDTTGQAYTDVTGQAEILALDEDQICVDVDVTYENEGQLVYRAQGTVLAPVVRSSDAFFFT